MNSVKEIMNKRIQRSKIIWPECIWQCPHENVHSKILTNKNNISIQVRPFHTLRKELMPEFNELSPSPFIIPKCPSENNTSGETLQHLEINKETEQEDFSPQDGKKKAIYSVEEKKRIEEFIRNGYCDIKSVRRIPKEASRQCYVNDLARIYLNRCEIGYSKEEIMRLQTRLEYECEKFDIAEKLEEECNQNFRSFLIEDWLKVQKFTSRSVVLKEKLKQAGEVYLALANEEASLFNVVTKLQDQYSVLKIYRDFWVRMYPAMIDQSLEGKVSLLPKLTPETRKILAEGGEVCISRKLADPFKDIREQNSGYYAGIHGASNVVTKWINTYKTLKILCENEFKYTENACEEIKQAIVWNNELYNYLKKKFLNILNYNLFKVICFRDVLNLESSVTYIYKRIFTLYDESTAEVSLLNKVRNIEVEYYREMIVLDRFDRTVVNKVMDRCFKEDITTMKRAEEARGNLIKWHNLVKSLYIAFEPPRKLSLQDKLKVKQFYSRKKKLKKPRSKCIL